MANTMRVKKGDLVQILSGKDRGEQGRVLEARPREGRVIVENLNVAKRHQKPRPMRDSSRMGGVQVAPGGIIEKASAVDVSNSLAASMWGNRLVVAVLLGESSLSIGVGHLRCCCCWLEGIELLRIGVGVGGVEKVGE